MKCTSSWLNERVLIQPVTVSTDTGVCLPYCVLYNIKIIKGKLEFLFSLTILSLIYTFKIVALATYALKVISKTLILERLCDTYKCIVPSEADGRGQFFFSPGPFKPPDWLLASIVYCIIICEKTQGESLLGVWLPLLDLEANYYARKKRDAVGNTVFSHDLMDAHAFEVIKELTFPIKNQNISQSSQPYALRICVCAPPSTFSLSQAPNLDKGHFDLLVGEGRGCGVAQNRMDIVLVH